MRGMRKKSYEATSEEIRKFANIQEDSPKIWLVIVRTKLKITPKLYIVIRINIVRCTRNEKRGEEARWRCLNGRYELLVNISK